MKKIYLLLFLAMLIFVGFLFFKKEQMSTTSVTTATPTPTAIPTPAANYKDMIEIFSPLPDTAVSSPLIIKGRARGMWFFEASFPVFLTDWDGRIIAQGIATAKEDWMTEEYVPFEAMLEFESPAPVVGVVNRGALILKKDNPSGLPEHDDAFELQVFFGL